MSGPALWCVSSLSDNEYCYKLCQPALCNMLYRHFDIFLTSTCVHNLYIHEYLLTTIYQIPSMWSCDALCYPPILCEWGQLYNILPVISIYPQWHHLKVHSSTYVSHKFIPILNTHVLIQITVLYIYNVVYTSTYIIMFFYKLHVVKQLYILHS